MWNNKTEMECAPQSSRMISKGRFVTKRSSLIRTQSKGQMPQAKIDKSRRQSPIKD